MGGTGDDSSGLWTDASACFAYRGIQKKERVSVLAMTMAMQTRQWAVYLFCLHPKKNSGTKSAHLLQAGYARGTANHCGDARCKQNRAQEWVE
jgi:hypothetical protein